MGNRTFEDVKSYVEWQSQGKCTVLSAKTEQHFDDLGVDVRVWNVKTDTDGDWWVVEGDGIPMNIPKVHIILEQMKCILSTWA